MSLTRTHIAFLGIISIFTGLIAPGTKAGDQFLSYLMTDMRSIAYSMLLFLILAFVFVALRKWSYYRLSASLSLIGVIILGITTLLGYVESTRFATTAHGLSWGWIFLITGCVLLFISYRSSDILEEETAFSEFIDTIIGMIGGFALACIAGILILSSLSLFSGGQKHDILDRMYGSGHVTSLSGGISSLSPTESMPTISYDRGANTLLTSVETASGVSWNYISGITSSSGILKKGLSPFILREKVYGVDANGYAYSGGKLLLGSRVSGDRESLLYKEAGIVSLVTRLTEKKISYTGALSGPIALSKDRNTIAWSEGPLGKKHIVKNGIIQSGEYDKIHTIDLSERGTDMMSLISSGTELMIIKNGTSPLSVPEGYVSGSYQSNGSHNILLIEKGGTQKVLYDLEGVSRDVQNIREIFLEEDGNSYAYFAQPIGENNYCLFTRYKGNICGLEGYMNPRFGADGGSILFAGKKDGIWSIYRNTDAIVKNTNYPDSIIKDDYAFFDTTNPRTYLFIEKNPTTGLYSYRKNGVLLPGTWEDVSVEVAFGYDNHILTAAKDSTGWRIIEL